MPSPMFLRTLLLSLACSAFVAAAPACADNGEIVIGQVIDLSSPNASLGRDYVAGIRTCFDMLNAAGGINGRKIRFVTRDDQASPPVAARMATELIENEGADYLLGGIGEEVTQAILATPAFRRSRLQLYAPLLSNISTTNGHELALWRPDYLHEVRHMLSHFGPLGMTRVGIAFQDDAGHRQTMGALTEELKRRGLQLAATARISGNEKQTAEEAAKLAAATPGVVIVVGDTINTGLFLKAFRPQAPKVYVAGTSLINLDTLRELAGARAVEWTVFSQVVPNPANGKTTLQREHLAMMKKYRDEPPSTLTLEGFAVAKTLALAIKRGKPAASGRQELLREGDALDIGGISVRSGAGRQLSDYVDIALFRRNGLVF